MLNILLLTALLGYGALMGVWFLGRPKKFLCKCSVFQSRRGDFPTHLKTPGLFLLSLCSALILLSLILDGHGVSISGMIWLFATVLYGFLAWRHSKRKRDEMKSKVLGVVRATVAGLKVVQVPVATFALLGALAACGGSPAPAAEPTPKTVAGTEGEWTYVKVPTQSGYQIPCVVYIPPALPTTSSISCDWRQEFKAN